MYYKFDGISLQNKRICNMDSLFIAEREINGQQIVLAVVCDGVGSLTGSEQAAAIVVHQLKRWLESVETFENLQPSLGDTLQQINKAVVAHGQAQGRLLATTATIVLFIGQKYWVLHVGDSRIYQWYKSRLQRLTIDHVSEKGNLVRCIGKEETIAPQYIEGTLEKGQVFLICSDGLYKKMAAEKISEYLSRLRKRKILATVQSMAEECIALGETDNISIAIIMVN